MVVCVIHFRAGCLLSAAFAGAGLIWGKPQTYKARSWDAACCGKVTEQTYPVTHVLSFIPDVLDQILAFYNYFPCSSPEQLLSATSSESQQQFSLQA